MLESGDARPISLAVTAAAGGLASLWDWRRRVAALYESVRAAPDPLRAAEAWRHGRESLFLEHPQSPLDPERRVPPAYFPYDPSFRFEVGLAPCPAEPQETVDAGPEGILMLLPFARTEGLAARLGGELALYWIAGYGGGAFLPFADATSGRTTYGGGRYLLDTIKGADLGDKDGRLVLDFNFAYNPSCAYSARWVCPLAPARNRLPAAIAAGERTPPPG